MNRAAERLLAMRSASGLWEGRLSSSPLATAIASFALDRGGFSNEAARGLRWIAQHEKPGGGWGDSPESPANVTATLLVRCALSNSDDQALIERTDQWLKKRIGDQSLAVAIRSFYGKDQTFSVPILSMCALAGLIEDWSCVPRLPFEMALFPHGFYRFLRLPVVSYALPALIAIGLLRETQKPGLLTSLRLRAQRRVLEKLKSMQPSSGGFLEAAPLTGFVAMSLSASGLKEHPVHQRALGFLSETQRSDGSWPIDVNLSLWLTSLAAKTLASDLSGETRTELRDMLLDAQWKTVHPFTQATAGGWGWTTGDGAVPDADDTSAALIALQALGDAPMSAIEAGITWLLTMQNRDGGLPTFCRGWGRLPFDRSCPDITAHALKALLIWRNQLGDTTQIDRAIPRMLDYLQKNQGSDHLWCPLWFGSQQTDNRENPVFGTARVLDALFFITEKSSEHWRKSGLHLPSIGTFCTPAFRALEQMQNPDGGWGPAAGRPSNLEETAFVLQACGAQLKADARSRAEQWIQQKTADLTEFPASPIGLYFASLWYSEELYPLIFSAAAQADSPAVK